MKNILNREITPKFIRLFSYRFFKETALVVIVLLLCVLIWQNQNSYVDNGYFVLRINNITGSACIIDTGEYAFPYDANLIFSKCKK